MTVMRTLRMEARTGDALVVFPKRWRRVHCTAGSDHDEVSRRGRCYRACEEKRAIQRCDQVVAGPGANMPNSAGWGRFFLCGGWWLGVGVWVIEKNREGRSGGEMAAMIPVILIGRAGGDSNKRLGIGRAQSAREPRRSKIPK